jgi:hypothetical protein
MLATLQDLETYKKSAVAVAKKYFTINDIDDFYKKKDARPLIFCHFARGMGDKTYDEVGCFSDEVRVSCWHQQSACRTASAVHTPTGQHCNSNCLLLPHG